MPDRAIPLPAELGTLPKTVAMLDATFLAVSDNGHAALQLCKGGCGAALRWEDIVERAESVWSLWRRAL